MNERQHYDYVVLRYMHDIVSREFINVGVIILSPSSQKLMGRFQDRFDRAKMIFPDFDKYAFSRLIKAIRRGLDHEVNRSEMSLHLSKTLDLSSRLRQIMPLDDSSLQWSDIGSGLCIDLDETLDRLYTRFVSQYDTPESHEIRADVVRRRKDDDIWRPVKRKLMEKRLHTKFQKKKITNETDSIEFDRAYKNGQWHVFEAISFDLAATHNIKDKARRWLGHLAAVSDGTTEDLKVYFITGSPQNPSLNEAYKDAIKILRCVPFDTKIFPDDVDACVHQIEEEMLQSTS